jgi:hypothetical protein
MAIIKHILDFFLSLRTTLWLLGMSLLLMFVGAFIMPGRQEFQALHSKALFDWIAEQPLEITWWLWGLIGVLAVMAVNTLFCSFESIINKRKVTHWLLLISPQIIHIGFLFILLAHLLSGLGAYQMTATGREGSVIRLSGSDTVMRVDNINITLDYYGYVSDYSVDIEYMSDGKVIEEDTIRPNDPSDKTGLNIIVKDLRPYPNEAVLFQIHSEPGAVWALAGGILFMLGIVTLILLKIRMER